MYDTSENRLAEIQVLNNRIKDLSTYLNDNKEELEAMKGFDALRRDMLIARFNCYNTLLNILWMGMGTDEAVETISEEINIAEDTEEAVSE